MEAQLLRTFVAVARLASFSAAAAELGYTQAAVSQQIAALENDLKTRLLSRRPVEPTEAGARLLEHAEPILLRLDAARADVTRMTQRSRGDAHSRRHAAGGREPASSRRRSPNCARECPAWTSPCGREPAALAIGVARGEPDLAPDRRPGRPR